MGNKTYFTSNIQLVNVLPHGYFCISKSAVEQRDLVCHTDLLYLREKRCWSLVASGRYQAEPSVSTAIRRKARAAVMFKRKQLEKRTSVLIPWLNKPIPAMSAGYFTNNSYESYLKEYLWQIMEKLSFVIMMICVMSTRLSTCSPQIYLSNLIVVSHAKLEDIWEEVWK